MAPVDLEKDRAKLIVDLRQRKYDGDSLGLAKAIVQHLRKLVAQAKYHNISELLDSVLTEGRVLSDARRSEFIVLNMVFRVMKLIREERTRIHLGGVEPNDEFDSLNTLWESQEHDLSPVDRKELKNAMLECLNEFLQEMDCSVENVASVAVDHVQQGDTLLTHACSTAVMQFMLSAARKRQFRVMIAQGSPDNTGSELAEHLREASASKSKDTPKFRSIEVIEDAAMAAVLAQVSKVVIGAHAVLADGGFIGNAGVYALCLAAKHYAVPVIVVAPFYKLTPKFLCSDDQEAFNELRAPLHVLNGANARAFMSKTYVYNTAHDYVPPELVSLYLMQSSANAPSYVYRLLGEFFHPDDIAKAQTFDK